MPIRRRVPYPTPYTGITLRPGAPTVLARLRPSNRHGRRPAARIPAGRLGGGLRFRHAATVAGVTCRAAVKRREGPDVRLRARTGGRRVGACTGAAGISVLDRMALRATTYTGLALEGLVRRGRGSWTPLDGSAAAGDPVCSLQWQAALEHRWRLSKLIAPAPPVLERWRPSNRYVLRHHVGGVPWDNAVALHRSRWRRPRCFAPAADAGGTGAEWLIVNGGLSACWRTWTTSRVRRTGPDGG